MNYRPVFPILAVVFLVPVCVHAQSSVTLTGHVSEIVALSVPPSFPQTDVVTIGNTVRITVSGEDNQAPVIRVPLLVRSNSGFKVSALVESQTAELTQLEVSDVRATGTLVSPRAVSEVDVLDTSGPLLVLSGPRVSLGGTLASPNNALQVTLLIRMKPQPGRNWLAHLTFTGTAAPLIQ